jgi:hypothetical protein
LPEQLRDDDRGRAAAAEQDEQDDPEGDAAPLEAPEVAIELVAGEVGAARRGAAKVTTGLVTDFGARPGVPVPPGLVVGLGAGVAGMGGSDERGGIVPGVGAGKVISDGSLLAEVAGTPEGVEPGVTSAAKTSLIARRMSSAPR